MRRIPLKSTRLGETAVWVSNLTRPGYIIRLAPGSNPPDTALAEIYKIRLPGSGIRGMDVDRNGVAWLPLDSGHIASFDRRKCQGAAQRTGCRKGREMPRGLFVLCFAAAFSICIRRYRPMFFLLAALVTASRLLSEAAYLSDVAAGLLLGAVIAIVLEKMFARLGFPFRARSELRT
jgi:hypothetical protein